MKTDFYLTGDTPCSYSSKESERCLFTKLDSEDEESAFLFSFLTENGFRRSQNYMYRPACSSCSACRSIRVDTFAFKPDKTQRKVFNRLDDSIYVSVAECITDEHYSLYKKYEMSRHSDSEMAEMTFDEFRDMVEISPIETYLYEFRDKNTKQLRAAMLIDHLSSGLSAVYSFFDVSNPKESLGTYMIIKMITWCRDELQLPYLYLGYYIRSCRKMNYKNRYRPFEIYDYDSSRPEKSGRWQRETF